MILQYVSTSTIPSMMRQAGKLNQVTWCRFQQDHGLFDGVHPCQGPSCKCSVAAYTPACCSRIQSEQMILAKLSQVP